MASGGFEAGAVASGEAVAGELARHLHMAELRTALMSHRCGCLTRNSDYRMRRVPHGTVMSAAAWATVHWA